MKNQTKIRSGIYPTMITPYTKENCLDEKALRQMVQWYARKPPSAKATCVASPSENRAV